MLADDQGYVDTVEFPQCKSFINQLSQSSYPTKNSHSWAPLKVEDYE